MDESEIFRANLLAAMAEKGWTEAELSVRANLNRRAVTDIRERKAQSPKLSTVFRLAEALNVSPADLLGLGPRHALNDELAQFLASYSEEDQARFLTALRAFPLAPS